VREKRGEIDHRVGELLQGALEFDEHPPGFRHCGIVLVTQSSFCDLAICSWIRR
jgi:hypothetical protein